MQDIVFPQGDEKEFIAIGDKLGISNFIFCYDLPTALTKKPFLEKKEGASIGVHTNKPMEIKKAKQKGFFILSSNNDRSIIQSSPHMIFEVENLYTKDSLHFRNSGLNHVLFKLMKEKNVSLGVSFSSLLNSSGNQRAILLGRIRQNISLAKKYKVKVEVRSFARDPYEMRSNRDKVSFLNVFS